MRQESWLGWGPSIELSRTLISGSLVQEAFSDFQAELGVSSPYLKSTKHTSIILHMPFQNCRFAHLVDFFCQGFVCNHCKAEEIVGSQ